MAHTINSNSSIASVFAYKVVTFFERIGTAMAKRAERRETFKTLHRLTDRELNDIGISRGDIHSIASGDTSMKRGVEANKNLKGWV